ncbi:MAG: beta-lactamase family protein [Candidatus Eremiobacteraeota bacterium]|nr:beta-lactamase family protein [Candidatus Eremiobacteraeota bacterium]
MGTVDAILSDACGKRFTAAVVRVERGGAAVFERAYGMTRDDRAAVPIHADTAFDLASLSKLFTASVALRAVADGSIDLDEPLLRWFPIWRATAHAPITLRMLLAHTSGINSGADYRELLGSNVEEFALTRELVGVPGEAVVYSDLGFIVLGRLCELLNGASLATLVNAMMRSPTLRYRPEESLRSQIPATEDDGWRGRVQGFVHDEKAYLIGGVAGHAGLFGSAFDVARLGEIYLGPLRGRPNRFIPPALVREATREQADDPTLLRRGLGWALKTADTNSCGRAFARESFGHTGFVGTCIWIDPTRDLSGVLLTNSVYYGRSDTRDLRASVYEAIVADAGLQ